MGDSEAREPLLSILVLVGDHRERAEACLSSILSQTRLADAEILVIECGRDSHPPLRGSERPRVRVMDCPKPPTSGLARAHAVRSARAAIVAFLEEHVRVEDGWLAAVIAAHQSPAAAIGPVMICGNPGEGVSDAIYVMNYSEYLPSSPLREDIVMLEGHNCTYKRDVLLSYGDRLPLLMSNEPLLHWQLREDGHVLQLNPAIRVIHRNEVKLLDICRGYFLWSVNFGASRASIQAFPWWKRWLYILGAPVIPLVRAARMARTVYRLRDRALFLTLLRFLPAILVAQLASALGQSVGLVFGRLSAEPAFLDYEVNVDRGVLPSPESR